MKLKKTGTGLVVTLLLLSVFSVASFAYSFEYTSLPSDYQEQIAEMYDEYHSFDPACYSFETFKDMSTVFPDTSSPSWRSLSSFNSGGLSSQSDFKAFADSNPDAPVIRCIYAENTDSSDRYTTMYATADIISNRSTTSGYSDGTYTRCSLTESSLESATHYYDGVYNPIRSNAPPVLYGTTVFYSY